MAPSWKSWLANEGSKHLFLLLWLCLNVGLFWKTFRLYYCKPQYYYLHQMLGLGLCLSRASAAVLNLNCSLVLLPVLRVLLALVRGSQKLPSRKARRLLDKSKAFHVTCGLTVCIFSVIHVAAHLVNALNFSVNYSEEFLALNAASYRGEDPRKFLFATVPGLTGVLMVLILFLMSTASTYAIRVSDYDIFWYTHNLFFVFYLLLILHVSRGVLKYQTNLKEHPPGCYNPNGTIEKDIPFESGFKPSLAASAAEHFPGPSMELEPLLESNFSCAEVPKFQACFPETWLWISGPLCLYCVERLYRYIYSSYKPVTLTAVINHPSDVLEIQMMKESFKARPGQYVVLHCPSVSSLESHPFTLTMCPTATKATFGVHIKVVGDWTERFRDQLLLHSSWDAAILPVFHQRCHPKDDWNHYKLRRLYFIWVCRDILSFHWFADLLCKLHNKLWEENRPDFINIQLYLSQTDGIQKIIGEKYQVLNRRLFIGRPRWKLLFNEIAKYNRQKTVGVFCCGPCGISKAVHRQSNRDNPYGTKFEYNKESFS
ncbi:NADPH oxidase 4 isoform X2 [Pantherophis guttatus]|uniref:NADPH oxidase 4 isoform X2 n=1 Tax=Pantherophis guttatus TaxID=94885 RepID=A0ABM3Z1C5_PANGU|nr:NADPH oxidase 4 isoform X2 [Pantherophis guttatus]